jgi:uncharacterized protein (DUF924 family)
MTSDLGAGGGQVHAETIRSQAEAVIAYWFDLPPDRHFAKDEALDAEIADRFGSLRDQVKASEAAGWRDSPVTLLAAIILLDQFSRNIHRGTAEAFAADDLAVSLTLHAIQIDWELRFTPEQHAFLYLPLMHAEGERLQDMSVDRFAALGQAENLRYAIDHHDVFRRFGRFPSRNAALGRVSTPSEREYLQRPDAGW